MAILSDVRILHSLTVAGGVFVLNIPFGYWRADEERFSKRWFLSVHAPVPLVAAIRVLSGLGWQLATFPLLVAAFFSGQFLGGRIHDWRACRSGSPVTACLVWDEVRRLMGRRNAS